MWKIEDFWKVFNFIKNDKTTELNENVQAIAKSDLSKANNLFELTIDQLCYSDDDYIRLRKFFIDWYSSLKTLSSVQKNITDIYGLPDSHLDELFRSRGFHHSTKLGVYNLQTNYNKGNFYYDLVNLYKKKGAPKTLLNVLRYFGFQNLELLEYMTYRRISSQKIEFHSVHSAKIGNVYPVGTDILNYDETTGWDPHYLTSEISIIKGQNSTKLHLPTKSPYFSLRHYISLNDYIKFIQFIARTIQDQYFEWKNDNIKPKQEIYLNPVALNISVLETYLSAIYIYYKHYSDTVTIKHPETEIYDYSCLLGDHGEYFTCYDGTNADYLNIVHEFNEYVNTIPHTREDIKNNQDYYYEQFTRNEYENFIKDDKTAGKVLKEINIELYNKLNDVYAVDDPIRLIGKILTDLMIWMNTNISIGVPNIDFLLLGKIELLNQLGGIIDFFKPYHARLLSYDVAYVVDDKNKESLIVEDFGIDSIEENIFDWDTCNSKPCCMDSTCHESDDFHYARETYDCGSFYDIGGACDAKENSFMMELEDHNHENLNCRVGFLPPENYVESVISNLPSDIHAIQSGGFVTFDEGGCFDLQYANDVCVIQII